MPILYGTTSDGESLPVQVNEFGQLVAQGLLGPPGPEGPPGPPNPDGELPFLTGVFTPVWQSSDESGSCLFDYEQQQGYWIRYGNLLVITVRLVSQNDVVTNARGNLLVGGLPEDLVPLSTGAVGGTGLYTFYQARFRGLADLQRPGVMLTSTGDFFSVRDYWNGNNKSISFSVLDGSANSANTLTFTYAWFHADAASSGQVTLDGLM